MKTMPEILRELRASKSMTQSDVAKILGLTTNAYQSYERGTSEPGCKALSKLADFYGVTTDYLLGREAQTAPLAGMNFKPVDNDEFIRLYSVLPESVKEIFVDTMAKLAQAQKQQDK